MHRRIVLYICRSWLLGITEHGTVRLRDVYDDSVEVYTYYNIPPRRIFYLFFIGGHWLLLLLSGSLDMPYSVELWCIGVFSGPIKLNTCQMMGPMTE